MIDLAARSGGPLDALSGVSRHSSRATFPIVAAGASSLGPPLWSGGGIGTPLGPGRGAAV